MKDEIKSITFLENDLLAVGKCNNYKIEIWNVTNQSRISNLNDHNDCVNALLSVRLLNQSFLISGSDDTTIRLYDNNFKTLQILNIQDSVLTLNYNTNSMILIAGRMKDNSIKIWTFAHKILIEKVSAHNDTIRTICVLENGLIATGSYDTTIKIWKINNQATLEPVTILRRHTNWVIALMLLKNNSLVSGSFDTTINVWNQKTDNSFECVASLKHSSGVWSLAISGSSLLISGHWDGTIQIRNQTSLVLLQTLEEHKSYVTSIILLNNGNLASGSNDRSIMIWQKLNETSFELIKILKGHTDDVFSLAVLPNNIFASASYDKTIKIWDQTSFECIYNLNGHTDFVNSLVVVRNEYLISISNDQSIIFWDILNNFTRLTTTKTAENFYSIALFSNDIFITGSWAGSIQMFDIKPQINYFTKLTQAVGDITSFIFYQKSYLISGHSNGMVKIFMFIDFSFVLNKNFKAHNSDVTCLENIKINEYNFFATGSSDNQIKIWNLDFNEIQTLSGYTGPIISLIYWMNTNSLISSSKDLKINFYKATNIQRINEIQAHT